MLAQYKYSSAGSEYNAPVYVKRRNTFHLDSSPDLFGELKACWYCVNVKLTLTVRLFDAVWPLVLSSSDAVQLLCWSL